MCWIALSFCVLCYIYTCGTDPLYQLLVCNIFDKKIRCLCDIGLDLPSFRQINIHNKLWSAAVFQEPQMFVNIHAWTQKFVTLHLEKKSWHQAISWLEWFDVYTKYIWDPSTWASWQIRKIVCCACVGNAGNVFPATAGWRSRHKSRYVRDARAVMRAGIAK